MKKILLVSISILLILSFSACSFEKDKPTTTAPTSEQVQTTTSQPVSETTTEQETTQKKVDISFIYSGYWYKNEGNKVLALKFDKDGSLTVSTYRRKNISSASNEPDSVIYGRFSDNADGSLKIYPDNEFEDEFYIYTLDSDNKTMTAINDDPEGSSEIKLVNFSELSKKNAKQVLLGDN